MARVYLSATRRDLAAECKAVKDWLTRNGYEPVESYTSDSAPVLASCLTDVESCGLYLLIQGYRYGARPTEDNPQNLSITHLEYRHAGDRNIPRIVLQQTNIPNVELTDLRNSEELASVKAFHDEVTGSTGVRPARFSGESELIAAVREGITKEARRLDLLPECAALREAFRRASRDLLTWPDTLPGGGWMERPELQTLRARVLETEDSITLLLGEPGCGKSALLARLGREVQDGGIPVLGIKANLLPETVHTREALQDYLELPVPVTAAVQTLAQEGPVLVLLDQLDALADLVVQHSARLRVLLNLVRDLAETPNVHLVVSCRLFEQRHDPSLRYLKAEVLHLELPPWTAVEAILGERGVRTGHWSDEMRGTLRVPEALNTFLSLLRDTDEPGLLNGFQGMLQEQWEQRVLCDSTGARRTLLLDLARQMAEREVLWQPVDRFAAHLDTLRILTAEGLLRWENGSGRIEFRHQTLFEFVRARAFLDEQGSLTAAVVAGQGSLRIRPQLWHALGFLRRVAPDQYDDELRRLWDADLRPHLHMLLIEFLGMQTQPLAGEVRLAFENLNLGDPWFRRRFLAAVAGSPGWFVRLVPAHLPQWMSTAENEAAAVQPILTQALAFDADSVLALVDAHWLPYPDKDLLSWRILAMGRGEPRDSDWVDRLRRILRRTDLPGWMVNQVAGIIGAVLPDEAPRLVHAWLERQWRQARAEVSADDVTKGKAETDVPYGSPLGKQANALLEGRDLHDLPVIAEAAPRAFAQTLWPLYVELHEYLADKPRAFVVGYRGSRGHDFGLDEDTRLERPLLTGFGLAVAAWAQFNPDEYLEFVRAHAGIDLLPVQRLLAQGLVHCAPAYPEAVLEHLRADPRRLALGPVTDAHRDSCNLIQALAPHLDADHLGRLELTLRNWRHYDPVPEDDAATRMNRLRGEREHRLRLLRALPEAYRSPQLLRLVEQEERALPDAEDGDVWVPRMRAISSPVSGEQMAKARDDHIVNLFTELTDETGWRHPRHFWKGGSIEAGRELAKLAETDPERAVRLARRLLPGINEGPVGEVLGALHKAGYSGQAVFSLVEEFSARGFSSPSFRQNAADAVCAAVTPECPVPDRLLDLLEGWLAAADPNREGPDGEPPATESEASLLWGWLRMVVLPAGNYPILAALSRACLAAEPPRVDRWLAMLESHLERKESLRVWAALASRDLRWLHLAARERALAFLARLLDVYPGLLDTREGILLVAIVQRWVPPERTYDWLGRMARAGPLGAQGYGEVLMLRHILFPNEDWPGQQVDALLAAAGEGTAPQRVGLAYAVVELWSDPKHRHLAHRRLLRLLATRDESVVGALGGIFLKTAWPCDRETGELLDALRSHPAVLKQRSADRLGKLLEDLVETEPRRVARLCNVLLDQVGKAMGDVAMRWYLSGDPLASVALLLQDMGEPHRQAGLALFERMLEFNLPQAADMVLSLDDRTPNAGDSQPVRRLKRRRKPPRRR